MTSNLTNTDQSPPSGPSGGPNPLIQLRTYWEGLRLCGGIPMRSQISPRGIESALSSTFLIERVAPGIARFRIAGMDLADFMGLEVRGMPFFSVFSPSARTELSNKLERVFQAPALLTMSLTAERGIGRPALDAQALLLPLLDDHGRLSQAIGAFALSGKVGRSPRRFDIQSAQLTRLEIPDEAYPVPHLAERAAVAMVQAKAQNESVEAKIPFTHAKSDGERPYLRLVK